MEGAANYRANLTPTVHLKYMILSPPLLATLRNISKESSTPHCYPSTHKKILNDCFS